MRQIVVFFTWLAFSCGHVFGAKLAAGPLSNESGVAQLFVDDFLIASQSDLKRMHQSLKQRTPLPCGPLSRSELSADLEAQPLAKRRTLIFSDDFTAVELGKAWRILWPRLTIADGRLSMGQVKPEHSAVGMVAVGRKDLMIEFKFRLGAATSINAVCNDRDYKEGHGGHICRVSLSPKQIFLADDKERLRHEIEELKKEPSRREEVARLTAGRSQSIPVKLEPSRWYQLDLEIVDDEMRVSLDGKGVGYLRSSGLAHPMKSDFYFAVSGQDAMFDDVRIWQAESARAK